MEKVLKEGEYVIPMDCVAKKVKQGDNVVLSVSKRRNHIVTNDRCRDCKWFGTDYSTFNWSWMTTVCMLKPRHTDNKRFKRQMIHYHVRPLQNICGRFERNDLTE